MTLRSRITKMGNQVAAWAGENMGYGVVSSTELEAASTAAQAQWQSRTLAQLLPYDSFDPETGIFHNRRSAGFVLESSLLTGANEEAVNILASTITESLPPGADIQFLLWGSNRIQPLLDSFRAHRSKKGDIYAWLASKRVEFLENATRQSASRQGSFLLRDFRLFISVSLPEETGGNLTETLVMAREDIVGSLKSIQMFTKTLNADDLINVLNDLLHPSEDIQPSELRWNPQDAIALQISDPEVALDIFPDRICMDRFSESDKGQEKFEARVLTVREFPGQSAQWKMTDAIGQMFNTALQIPCSFALSFSIRLIENEKAQMIAQMHTIRKEKAAKSPLAKFMPRVTREYEDWKFTRERLADGDRLTKTFFCITLFSPSKTANQAERKLRDLYRANGWRLAKTVYLQLQSFLAMLPMIMSEGLFMDLKQLGRLHTMTAFNAVNFAPLQGEWKGTSTPGLLLPGRRGQVATWDPFDNQEGNYNIALAAAAGKGKSMLANEMMLPLLGAGDFVAVIDNGRSYEKTCRLLNGAYIEFNESTEIVLNPFTSIVDFDHSLPLLKPLLAAMARPTSQSTDEELVWLEKAARAAYTQAGKLATISTVADWLAKEDSAVCQNIAHLLFPYTRDGMYARYFEGRANIDLSSQFIVLELQELKAKKDLERIVLLLLMYQLSERMYSGPREQRKLCLIDEAWDLFGGDNAGSARFIEQGFRTARKFNASFVTVVQSLNDYFKNQTTITCLENADVVIFLGQKPDTIDQIKKNERFQMDAWTERLFKSLKKTDDFSECIISTPSGLSVHRVLLDPYSRILYSSKAEEFAAVRGLQDQGHTLQDAIQKIAEGRL